MPLTYALGLTLYCACTVFLHPLISVAGSMPLASALWNRPRWASTLHAATRRGLLLASQAPSGRRWAAAASADTGRRRRTPAGGRGRHAQHFGTCTRTICTRVTPSLRLALAFFEHGIWRWKVTRLTVPTRHPSTACLRAAAWRRPLTWLRRTAFGVAGAGFNNASSRAQRLRRRAPYHSSVPGAKT